MIVATPPATALRTSSGMAPPTGRGIRRTVRAVRVVPGTLDACRPPCPTASRSPRTARCRRQALRRDGRAARCRSTCTSRSARPAVGTATSTPTRPDELGPSRLPAVLAGARRCAEIDLAARRCVGTGDRARRCPRSSSAAALRRCSAPAPLAGLLDGDPRAVRADAGRRGHHRGQPRVHRPGTCSTRCGPPGTPGCRSGCSRRRRTCCGSSTGRHTPGRALEVVGWARPAGFEHVNLDLIYGTPGETDADFAALAATRRSAPASTTSRAYSLIVEPGHPAGPAGSRRASCRCPTTTCSPTATCSPTRR